MRRRTAIGALAGAAGLAAAAGLAQKRLLGSIAADPEYDRLRRPLGGEESAVRAADGTELHVEAFGPPGAPKLLLVHGWMCSLEYWRYQIEELVADFRIIAYDQRGHGRSAEADDYSFDEFADDFGAILAATVPEGERAIAVGHSMGAMTIAAWAGRHPAQVKRLRGAMLTNTGLGDLITESVVVRTPNRLEGFRDPLGRALLSATVPMPASPSPVGDAAVRYVTMNPSASPAQVAFVRRMVLSCNPKVRGAAGRAMAEMDLWNALENLDVPTTVVAGEKDRLTPPTLTGRLAETLPNLHTFETIPGIGHMSALEAPEETNRLIRELDSATKETETEQSLAA